MKPHIQTLLILLGLLIAAKSQSKLPSNIIVPKCPDPAVTLCSTISQPVCGYQKNGSHSTYTNQCIACTSGIYGYTKGACPEEKCVPNPKAPCTLQYNPQCGTSPQGKRVNYSNPCVAKAACATDLKQGECPAPEPPKKSEEKKCNPKVMMKCTKNYTPVCGKDINGNKKTFSNTCVAKMQCATQISQGACKGTFVCTPKFTKTCNPKIETLVAVCGIKKDGNAKVYSNDCLACRDGAVTVSSSVGGNCKSPFDLT